MSNFKSIREYYSSNAFSSNFQLTSNNFILGLANFTAGARLVVLQQHTSISTLVASTSCQGCLSALAAWLISIT
jgi:hypothetical protein